MKHRSATRSESIRQSWVRRRAEGKDRMPESAKRTLSEKLRGRPRSQESIDATARGLRATTEAEKAARSGKVRTFKCEHCGNDFESFRVRPKHCLDCGGPNRESSYRLSKYGLTHRAFTEMLESQGNTCAICHQPFGPSGWGTGPDGPRKDRIAVDHDHATGRVRGLLHVICNRFLGQLEAGLLADGFPAAAREYLRTR